MLNDGFINFAEFIRAHKMWSNMYVKAQQNGGGSLLAVHPFYAVGLNYLCLQIAV